MRVAQPPEDLKNRKKKQQCESTKESESICYSPEEAEGLTGGEGGATRGEGEVLENWPFNQQFAICAPSSKNV